MSHGTSNGTEEGPALEPSSSRRDLQSVARRSPWRFVPFSLLLAGGALGYAYGLQDYLSLSALVDHRETLAGYVAAYPFRSAFVFFATYVAVVVFSVPVASVLTISAGFLFGWLGGATVAVLAATLGACLLFVAARGAFSDVLRRRAGGFLDRLAEGFRENAFLYLLVLRLAPVFPFFVINIAPAFFQVKLRTYAIATLIGIVPGTLAYTWLGCGLGEVIALAAASGRELALSDFVTRDISLALVALALIAALPLAFRLIQSRRKGA
ncbi:TVP38/TMEM64 family protein [Mesorhizobium plurifarium]|uniref:TVP38/TMEM64 family protein n=1 Tax=Sinorhizobium arboris TaxID=76745 RepID=UPI000406B7FF|nr:TVP38/TMEM64 family protein [Sinorhizobium arboris]PST27119.1 TVP38/TMEM64 family protein [Mesorhizobium plurifarium]